MNWTEGNLARHSRGKQRNALITRQKNHFAKVRHNLLSGRARQGPAVTAIPFLGLESASESPGRGLTSRKQYHQFFQPSQSSNLETGWPNPTRSSNDNHAISPTNLDRRKRLLRKSDWAGLRLQRPLDISFPGQVYATKRWARSARSPERITEESRNYATPRRERSRHLKRSSMKIHVGGQEILPSVITGSQRSIKHHTPEPNRSAYRSQQHQSSSETNQHVISTSRRQQPEHLDVLACENSPAISAACHRIETPANVVYSSSVIYEPAPRRNGDFRVLQWSPSNSEDGGSMQVEIEQPTKIVSPSQESEQQRWKDWMSCRSSPSLPSNCPLQVRQASDVHTEHSSSSALTLPSHLQLKLPSFDLLSDTQPIAEPEARPLPQTSSDYDSSERMIIEGAVEKHKHSRDDQSPPVNNESSLSRQKSTSEKKPDDDLNDIWMKFACGDDDSDEILMDAFKEAAHQAAIELRPSDTTSPADKHIGVTTTTYEAEEPSTNHQCETDAMSPGASSESHVATQGTTISESAPSSENASSVNATVGSLEGPARSTTMFVIPKAFVGKYVNTERAEAIRASIANMPRSGKKGRGKRGKKKATDGRTDIRDLPDFDGDPIEEIEED